MRGPTSPGTGRQAVLVDLVREALPEHRIEAHVLEAYPLDDHVSGQSSPGTRLTHLHFVFIQAVPAAAPEVVYVHPREEILACHAVADAWLC